MVFNMPPINSPGSGGVNLGTATGSLRIDTSNLKNAVSMVRQSVQGINQQMSKMGQGATSAMQKVRLEIEKIKGPLTALTAAGAGFVALGLKSADNLKAAKIQLTGMLGGLDRANALIKSLQEKSLATGQGFNSTLIATRLLLPTLENNTEELDRYLGIAIRLSTLNPAQGLEGAAFAINEFVSSSGRDIVSLAERFNLPKAKIRELMAETGDAGEALNILLTDLGITEETVAAMGDTMTVSMQKARSLIVQIAGTALQPMLETVVIPLLQKFSDFLVKLSEVNPKVLGFAGSVIALATAGGAALLTFAKLAQTLETIKTLSIAGNLASLGPLAAGGLAAAGGIGLGIGVTRAIGRAQGNEQLANANFQSIIEVLKQTVVVFASLMQPAGRALGELGAIVIAVGAQVKDGFGYVIEALANFITGIGEALNIQALQDAGAGLQAWADGLKLTNAEREELAKKMEETRNQVEQFGKGLGEAIAQALYPQEPAQPTDVVGEALAGAGIEQFTAEQVAAWGEFQADLKTIESQAQADRIAATEQFEQQRQDIEASYQKTLRRMNEDYGVEDERRETNRDRQIAAVNAKRDADIQAKVQAHNDRLTEIQEDARKREIRAQKDHQKRRRELQLELGKSLLKAASRLDAQGVINAIENYNEQNRKESESFSESKQQLTEQLTERLEQEQESHEERLKNARDAAAEQLDNLREQYAEEDRLRIEDRALRLRRMEEDHNEQLAELERTHQDRLTQINTHVTQERAAREQAFMEQINALGGHEGRMLDIQEQGQAQMEAALRRWWERQTEMINSTKQAKADRQEAIRRGDNYRGQYQAGGRIWDTGIYKLHAGEEVIKPNVAAAVRRMMGGSLDQNALVGALAGGGGTQIGNIGINIYAQPGMNEEQIGKIAVRELIRELGQI